MQHANRLHVHSKNVKSAGHVATLGLTVFSLLLSGCGAVVSDNRTLPASQYDVYAVANDVTRSMSIIILVAILLAVILICALHFLVLKRELQKLRKHIDFLKIDNDKHLKETRKG